MRRHRAAVLRESQMQRTITSTITENCIHAYPTLNL